MLTSFEILNGEMTPKYDEYNDIYTVTIKEEVTSLDIKYVVSNPNANVYINGNENIDKDTTVSIEINEGTNVRKIHLNVLKENTETTSDLKDYFTSLEVSKKKDIPDYIAPLIGASCFLIIIIVFSLLFYKKRN